MSATLRITSLQLVHPLSSPVSFTPITLGHLSSQGMSAITSTARPPAQLSSQLHSNNLRALELPRDVSHNVHSVSS